jgi:hypothetical protein
MKTVNLSKESPSVAELLAMARKKSVLVVSNDGTTYLLEEADNFDREVKALGDSDAFMKFLKKRSEEPSVISIDAFAKTLADKIRDKPMQTTRSASKPRRGPSARKKRSPRRG